MTEPLIRAEKQITNTTRELPRTKWRHSTAQTVVVVVVVVVAGFRTLRGDHGDGGGDREQDDEFHRAVRVSAASRGDKSRWRR